MLAPWKKRYDQPRQPIKMQRHYFANKDPYNQSYGFSITGFSSNHAWMKSWTIKKADEDHMKTIKNGEELMFLNCGVGELEIPSDCKEIKPVNPQGNQS